MSISSLATLSKQAAADAIISKTRTALASRSFALSPDPNVAQSIFQAITDIIDSLHLYDFLPQQQRSILKRIDLRAPDIAFLVAAPFASFYPTISIGNCNRLYEDNTAASIAFPHLAPHFASRFPATLLELDLGRMSLFDDVLIALAQSPASKSLKTLRISGSLSASCVGSWASFTALEHLSLKVHLKICEANFDEIVKLTQLRSIDLSSCLARDRVDSVLRVTRIVEKIFSMPQLEKIQLPSTAGFESLDAMAATVSSWVDLLQARPIEQNSLITLFTIGILSDESTKSKMVPLIQRICTLLGPLETGPAFPVRNITARSSGVFNSGTLNALLNSSPPEKWRLISALTVDAMKPDLVQPVLLGLSQNCPMLKDLTLLTETHSGGGYCTNMIDFGPIMPQTLESFKVSFSPNKHESRENMMPRLITCLPPTLKRLLLHATFSPPIILFEDEDSANRIVACILRDCPQLKDLSLINYVFLSQGNVDALVSGLHRLRNFEFTSKTDISISASPKLRHCSSVSRGCKLRRIGSFPVYDSMVERLGARSTAAQHAFAFAPAPAVEIGQSNEARMAIAFRNLSRLSKLRDVSDLTLVFEELLDGASQASAETPETAIIENHTDQYDTLIGAIAALPFARNLQQLFITTDRGGFPSADTLSTFPLSSLIFFSNITSLRISSQKNTDEVMVDLLSGLKWLSNLDCRGGTFSSLDWMRHPHLRCINLYWGWPPLSKPLQCVLTQEHLPSISFLRIAYSASTREDAPLSWTLENLPHLEHLSISARVTLQKTVSSIRITGCPKLTSATISDAGLTSFVVERVPALMSLIFRSIFGSPDTKVSINVPNLEYLESNTGGRDRDSYEDFRSCVKASCADIIGSGQCLYLEH